MENSSNSQFRFMIAAVLSVAVLFGWTYFFAPERPKVDEANVNANVAQTQANTAATPEIQPQPQNGQQIASTPDNIPNKTITIKSPLYEVKLDTKGAVATSWILKKNVSPQGEFPLYGDGSTEENKKPLQLIPEYAAAQNPRQLPFRLTTGDQNLDSLLNERNYQVSAEQETIELAAGETKKIDFTYTDQASGTEAVKSFVFNADSYITDLSVRLNKNGQPVPNTKLLIGASVGDQSVPHYTFYKIESEAVASVGGEIERYPGASFTYNGDAASEQFGGAVDWAGVADSYFAMVAIPAQPTAGLEYNSFKYETEVEPYFDGIISWITRSPTTKITKHLLTAQVPISADGATNKIYTGAKDHFVLSEYNRTLTQTVGRPIDIEDVINYGWFSFLTKPLSIPILYTLNYLYDFTKNYGVAIILFTLFFYSLLFPMRWYQSKSFKKAQKNAPKMKEIQDKIKELQGKGVPLDDPRMRELQMQQLKMTKDALPIGGCLPMLLQFPLLIALYVTVTISLGIRQASFLWLPDLSAGDPYHALEFAFAFSMVLSMKFMPTTALVTPEQQMQQKMMIYIMPVMMLWIMWSAPAGLLLYWFVGNIIMFAQQMVINHINKTDEPPVVAVEEKEVKTEYTRKKKKNKPKLSTS